MSDSNSDKNKLQKRKKADDVYTKTLKDINSFINDSEKVSYALAKLSKESLEELTVYVANITQRSILLSKQCNLELVSYNLQIVQKNFIMLEKKKALDVLKESKSNLNIFKYLKQKHMLSKEIKSLNREISSMQSLISSYKSDLDTCIKALQICSEFGRRLTFYLSFD